VSPAGATSQSAASAPTAGGPAKADRPASLSSGSGSYLHAVARAQVGRPGNDGPFDLTKRVHRGAESSGIGTGFALAVLVPRQRPRASSSSVVESMCTPTGAGIGEYCPDLKGLIGPQ
jgi:hypothetical protein